MEEEGRVERGRGTFMFKGNSMAGESNNSTQKTRVTKTKELKKCKHVLIVNTKLKSKLNKVKNE